MERCMSQMTRTIHWPYCLSAGAFKSMGMSNLTRLPEFILLGLSSCPENQKPLFALFLIMYLVTLMGNLLIILAIRSDPQLQNPMYFFLSKNLVLCWYLLHNSYSPQDVSELFIREKDHFLCWMSGADVFLPSLRKHGQLPPGSHGHWPLCSYLQSLALCHCYEPWALYVATGLLHSFLLPSLPPACPPGESAHFLCIKCYPSLFLWCQPCSEAGLLFYLCQWSHHQDRRAGFCDGPICLHHHLLPENPQCGPQNSLSCWKTQSLLHLQLPSHCGDSLLWEYLLCLFPAIVQLHCQRSNSNSQLHCPATNVEPIYLQFKKQRHETGLREIDKQDEVSNE